MNPMRQQFKILWITVLVLAAVGVSQFTICTTIAIYNYPGGFSFSKNYLSELGRQATQYDSIYNGSIMFLGLSLIPSFALLWMTNTHRMWSMRAAAMFGIIASLGLIGMGVFPVDREFLLHYGSLALWMFPMIYMTVSFFFAVSRSRYVGIGFLSTSLVTVVTMIAVLMRTELTSLQLLHISVVAFGGIWMFYVLVFIYQSGSYMLQNWHLREDYSEQESQYFSTIVRNIRR